MSALQPIFGSQHLSAGGIAKFLGKSSKSCDESSLCFKNSHNKIKVVIIKEVCRIWQLVLWFYFNFVKFELRLKVSVDDLCANMTWRLFAFAFN